MTYIYPKLSEHDYGFFRIGGLDLQIVCLWLLAPGWRHAKTAGNTSSLHGVNSASALG